MIAVKPVKPAEAHGGPGGQPAARWQGGTALYHAAHEVFQLVSWSGWGVGGGWGIGGEI